MQIEFTSLIAQVNSNSNPRKASKPAAPPKATSRKHFAEQFEFPFVLQMSWGKSTRNIPVAFVGSAKQTVVIVFK